MRPMRLRDVPIHRKLTIITMLTSGLALLVAGLASVAYEQVVFRGSMIDRLSITASMVAESSAAALTFNDPASAAQTLKSLSADPHIVVAAIYGADGKLFAQYRRPGVPEDLNAPSMAGEGDQFDGDY